MASWAMASRWSTALVEPPMAATTVMAFSKASRVRMSRGLTHISRSRSTTSPACREVLSLLLSTAGMEAAPGRDIPRASMAAAMVLAVNSPAQEPSPGQARSSSSVSSWLGRTPLEWAPTASNTS